MRSMGDGLRCESRPSDWFKKPSRNLSVSYLGRSVSKLSPTTGASKGLNYPESWSNFGTTREEQGKEGMV